MKVIYDISDPNTVNSSMPYRDFSLEKLEMKLDAYYERVGHPPGVIYMSREAYRQFVNTMYGSRGLQALPLSKKKYLFHYPCLYGILPVICEYENKAFEIALSLSDDFEKEFEKIILGNEEK